MTLRPSIALWLNRELMSIATKTGDAGSTALMYNRRVSKSDPRVEAYGCVDELNAALGLARASMAPEPLGQLLLSIQKDLVGLMGELATALESVLRARGQRYVMANVPRSALDRVKEVLPGLNGPTVIDILNGGEHVAVHAVVPAAAIFRTIAQLKALGGAGILVTRIERLMP